MINIHPVEQDTLWPLHQKEDMGTQLIAGKTLSQLQYELAPDDKKFHLHANAWVSAADWEKLVTAPSDASLKTDDDELMAWSGEYDAKNTSITASTDSFLIRYPWEFLKIMGNLKIMKNPQKSHFLSILNNSRKIKFNSQKYPKLIRQNSKLNR